MIKLSDIYIGRVDAKNELEVITEDEKNEEFRLTYLVPDNIMIDDFFKLNQYYVQGLKGTGKTALLRYIASEVTRLKEADSHFILFKSDFNSGDRKDFARAARSTIVDKSNIDFSDEDYTPVWRWFIYQQLVALSEEKNKHYFYYDIAWDRFKTCVQAPEISTDQISGLMRLLPKLRRGSVEISGDIEALSGKFGLEFDWEDTYKTKVKFEKLVKQADQLFQYLEKGRDTLYLFFDELELVYNVKKTVRA